jgi:D-amino peptidase
MKAYISVDMEGVAGIVHVDQTRTDGQDFARGRELMTLEANAAALGAFDAGAREVLINDSHGDMRNLLFDRIDPRCTLLLGDGKPLSMMQGIDGKFDVAMFIGYHAGMGAQGAILDHTYYSAVVSQMRVNGKPVNEAGLNALLAGEFGTPVGLVSGDAAACRETAALIPGIETVVVKWAVTRYSARTLHPVEAQRLIREAATRVCRRAGKLKPLKWKPPYRLEVRLIQAGMADAAGQMPGADRVDGTTVGFEARTIQELFRAMLTIIRLAPSGIVSARSK